MLDANGIRDPSRLLSIGGPEAVRALLTSGVDAAFFVTAKPFPLLEPLVRAPTVTLVSFAGADAYLRRYPFLSKVVVPAGLLDLAANLPPADVALLAPAAALVARDGLHPAIVDLVMDASKEVHGAPQWFATAGEFPSRRHVDLPLDPRAERWFRSGPTFLRRHLPFWAATIAERVLILIPLVAIGVPIMNALPGLWETRFARRIHRGYAQLRSVEADANERLTDGDREQLLERLAAIDEAVRKLALPATQIEHLYHLRLHIDFLRRTLAPAEPKATGAGGLHEST